MAAQNNKKILLNTVDRSLPVSIGKVKLYIERASLNQPSLPQDNNVSDEDIQRDSGRLDHITNQMIQKKLTTVPTQIYIDLGTNLTKYLGEKVTKTTMSLTHYRCISLSLSYYPTLISALNKMVFKRQRLRR